MWQKWATLANEYLENILDSSQGLTPPSKFKGWMQEAGKYVKEKVFQKINYYQ